MELLGGARLQVVDISREASFGNCAMQQTKRFIQMLSLQVNRDHSCSALKIVLSSLHT